MKGRNEQASCGKGKSTCKREKQTACTLSGGNKQWDEMDSNFRTGYISFEV